MSSNVEIAAKSPEPVNGIATGDLQSSGAALADRTPTDAGAASPDGGIQALRQEGYSAARPQRPTAGGADLAVPVATSAAADQLASLTITSADGHAIADLRDSSSLVNIASPTMHFHRKDDPQVDVAARQVISDSEVVTRDGVSKVRKGDWIVAATNGENTLVPRDQFQLEPTALALKAPMQKYIKSLSIEAELITQPTEWRNPDAAAGAPAQIANAGDYWAKPKGQAPYVIPGAYFRDNYVQIPGSGEYARTTITNAQILDGPAAVWSKNSGLTSGAAGDFLITRPGGTQEILSAQKFKEQFASAELPSEQREPLSKPLATGERFVLDAQRGVTAEPWENGLILYDGKSVTVTDNRDSSAREYVEGRLVGEIKTVQDAAGQRVITRSYPYGDLQTVRDLPTLDSYKDLLERRPELKRAQELSDNMPMTHTIDTSERNALREDIRTGIREHMDSLRQTPAGDGSGANKLEQGRILHIVLGLSGSGKSTIANKIAEETHAFIPDVDEVKPKFPEWQGGIGAAATSVEAHMVMNPIIQDSLVRGDNLVVPVVGASTEHIEKLIANAKAQGYQVNLSLVDVPPTEAMKRIVGRLEKGGLYVDPHYLASLGNRPLQNFRGLVDKYMDSGVIASYHQINNLGRRPVLVDEAHISGAPNTSGLPDDFFAQANSSAKATEASPAGRSEAERVWQPGDQFRNSETAAAANADAGRAMSVVEALPQSGLVTHGEERPASEAVGKSLQELGLNPDQAEEVKGRAGEGLSRGLPYTVALGLAFGLVRARLAANGTQDTAPLNYGQ